MGEKKKPRVNMTMRLRVLTALFLVIGFGLVGVRLLYMQVFHHDFYIQKATSLQTRDTFITPNRGKIYDANMQVLAESAEVERITVSPKAVVSETKEKNGVTADVQRQTLATILSETLDVSYDSVMEKLNKTDSEYEIIAQKVDKDVTKELNAKLEAAGCTGVYSEPDTKRYYQHGSFLSAVLGYVGSDNNGAYGIESQYNDELSGTAGRIVRVQNAQNEDIVPDTQQYIPAKDGNSLVLTIDSDIQNYLEKHLETAFADNPEARDGVSGIVMNIKTGEVLAMANLPDFDPNDAYHLTSEVYINELKTDVQKILTDAKIAAVIPDKWYEEGGLANLPEELQKNDDIVSKLGSARVNILMKTWRNPVVSDNYEPGSTFKALVLAAALVDHFLDLQVDGLAGLLVAAFILKTGWEAAKDTLDPLLGRAMDPELAADIDKLVLSHPNILGIHDLVYHDYGPGRAMMSFHAEVPADTDLLEMHDIIDHIERELKAKHHIETVIHTDPVVNDERTNALREQVEAAAKALDPALSIHDLRLTAGPYHTNVLFDVMVPYGFRLTDAQVTRELRQAVEALSEKYSAVIQVDHSYVERREDV